jgi:hypothetical protein
MWYCRKFGASDPQKGSYEMTEKCCPSRDLRDLLPIATLVLLFLFFSPAQAADHPAWLEPPRRDPVRLQIGQLAAHCSSLMTCALQNWRRLGSCCRQGGDAC